MFTKKSELKEDTTAGLILGYEITDPKFKPILDLASKGEKGWKNPVFIRQLIVDPAPLILHEKWLYDEISISNALDHLKSIGVKDTEKLKLVLRESNRFESIDLQDYLNSDDDIDMILGTMMRCGNYEFEAAIDPLKTTYGQYAFPNNYEFERMNAGIIRTLSRKFPNLTPLDDSLRAPVYEYLGTKAYTSNQQNIDNVGKFIDANHNPLTPIPKFEEKWDPDVFIKLHKSKGADQLREIIFDFRNKENVVQEDIERYIDQSRAISVSLAPTRNVVYAFAGLGAATVSAIQAIVNPFFYIPTVLLAIVSADQLATTIDDRLKAEDFKWLDVAQQLSLWKYYSDDNANTTG